MVRFPDLLQNNSSGCSSFHLLISFDETTNVNFFSSTSFIMSGALAACLAAVSAVSLNVSHKPDLRNISIQSDLNHFSSENLLHTSSF